MPPRLTNLVPMLMCEDTQASIAFYADVLGFTVRNRMDNVGKSGWAMLEHGQVELMLASPTYIPEAVKVDGRHPQTIYYFYPDDVVALRASVVAKGHQATELVVRFYGMKEFEMLDPSGHVLVFGQPTDETPE